MLDQPHCLDARCGERGAYLYANGNWIELIRQLATHSHYTYWAILAVCCCSNKLFPFHLILHLQIWTNFLTVMWKYYEQKCNYFVYIDFCGHPCKMRQLRFVGAMTVRIISCHDCRWQHWTTRNDWLSSCFSCFACFCVQFSARLRQK
jgi:hypothetical protein